MPIISHSHAPEVPWRPGYRKWDVAGHEQGVTSTFSINTAEPGAGAPLHTHTIDELIVILKGTLEVSMDGETQTVGPDHTVVIPPGGRALLPGHRRGHRRALRLLPRAGPLLRRAHPLPARRPPRVRPGLIPYDLGGGGQELLCGGGYGPPPRPQEPPLPADPVPGQTFHSHLGQLPHDSLIDSTVGGWYRTDRGHVFLAVRPTLGDFVLEMPRGPQIIYPKDLGNIITLADIFPGATVVEAGLGSGSLTAALLRAVGTQGRVITYEINEKTVAAARRNIEKVIPDASNLTVTIGDIYQGIAEENVDRIVLDVPEPWQAVGAAADALVMGGIFLSFLPPSSRSTSSPRNSARTAVSR